MLLELQEHPHTGTGQVEHLSRCYFLALSLRSKVILFKRQIKMITTDELFVSSMMFAFRMYDTYLL